MTYDADMQWDELVKMASQKARVRTNAVNDAKLAQEEWNSFRAARTDAQLATYFDTGGGGRAGTTAAEAAELKQAFTAMKAIFDFCDNVAAPVQGDRFADFRKFT